MRALILADLDNVLGPGGTCELVADMRSQLEELGRRRRVDECISVFAFNTESVREYDLTWAGLRDAAQQMAEALGAPRWSVEIALAPIMPQTADVLIARLARDAPTKESAGDYELAVAITRDDDLRNGLGARYARSKAPWMQVSRTWLASAWAAGEGAKPVVRKPPTRAQAAGGEPVELSDVYTQPIERNGQASWASTRRCDVEPGLELNALATLVDEDPWLLSQLGATAKSTRGVARMIPLAMGEPPILGTVSSKEGLELRGEASRPRSVSSPIAASVGIGAARFAAEHATLPSRLPVEVLQAVSGPVSCDRRGVNVRHALQQLSVDACLGDRQVKVKLRAAGTKLLAKVEHGDTHQPGAWWLGPGTQVKSERRLPDAAALLPTPILATGVACRPVPCSGACLALRSPLDDGTEVHCPEPIAQGTIGQGWFRPRYGKERPVAIYTPHRHVAASDCLIIQPIQSVTRTGAFHAVREDLLTLPLVVPR